MRRIIPPTVVYPVFENKVLSEAVSRQTVGGCSRTPLAEETPTKET